jgi:hypothetical protein
MRKGTVSSEFVVFGFDFFVRARVCHRTPTP